MECWWDGSGRLRAGVETRGLQRDVSWWCVVVRALAVRLCLGLPCMGVLWWDLPPSPSNNGAFAYWEWSGEEPVDSV